MAAQHNRGIYIIGLSGRSTTAARATGDR